MSAPAIIECKATLAVDDAGTISGTAWPFGTPDRVGDLIMPGAFRKAVAPLPMLAFHAADDVVGAWTEVREDGVGLRVKGRLLLDDLPRARELHAMVKAGALRGLSIGFVATSAKSRPGGGRTISAVDLVEVSLVSVPAHPKAGITAHKTGAEAIRLAAALSRAAARLRA